MLDRRVFLMGCTASAGLAATGPAFAKTTEPMTVILDWLLNPNHAALFTAQHSGAFARAGLEVNLVSPSDPDSPCRLVAAGQADLAVSYGSQINMITSAGLPLLRVATLVDRPLNTVMTRGDIQTLSDLRGKTIGYSVAGVEEAVLDVMLASAGVRPGEVTTVKVNYNMVTAMLSHRLDAATGAYRNAEVIEIEQMGAKPHVFLPEDHGVPPYDELILVARHDRVGDARLKRFILALREAVATLQKDPDALWTAFADAHGELNTPYNKLSWQATVPLLARDPGALDERRYLAFQDFAVARHIIATPQPIGGFAVQIVS